MNIQEQAAQASVILGNEVFKESVKNIELSLIEQWKHADKQEDRGSLLVQSTSFEIYS